MLKKVVRVDVDDKVPTIDFEKLEPLQGDLKSLSEENFEKLKKSILDRGFFAPVFVWSNGKKMRILDGHQRVRVLARMKEAGYSIPKIPCFHIKCKNEVEAKEKLLAITSNFGKIERQGLYEFVQGLDQNLLTSDFEFSDIDTSSFMEEFFNNGTDPLAPEKEESKAGNLSEKFLVPPFTILDARQGYWQLRKNSWLALGIKSELGRDGAVTWGIDPKGKSTHAGVLHKGESGREHGEEYEGGDAWAGAGTSIFDPTLCELAYTWFCPPKAKILDPFAGGSVRGIVASKLGHLYTGVELRKEQVEANIVQGREICKHINVPTWHCGDSKDLPKIVKGHAFDFLFSCPPYADLEVYSDNPKDLSTMQYDAFLKAYEEIIAHSVSMLKNNRFACFVVGDIRDKKGNYRNFVSDTISAFLKAGMKLYNEAILVTSLGSLPIRVGRQFQAGRKLGKTHQNVLVFVKGDAKKATEYCGPVDVQELELESSSSTTVQ